MVDNVMMNIGAVFMIVGGAVLVSVVLGLAIYAAALVWVRKYETGENEPALSQLKLIANHYHVSLDELAWDEGERESKPL